MPHLDVRLRTVAQQIRSRAHADIGSDHGHLLLALLGSGRIQFGIAVENKAQPYQNSLAALRGSNAECRQGNGFAALSPGEVDSASICGMGGESMARILSEAGDRLPDRLVLQPNRRAELVRQWALDHSYQLVEEQIAWGHWPYEVLSMRRANHDAQSNVGDKAYEGVCRTAALLFGPLLIRRWEDDFVNRLIEEREYLRRFDRLGDESSRRLTALDDLLERRRRYG